MTTPASQPRREGYLKKEGGQRKTWRKRWCVLAHTSGTLFYHSKKGGNLKGKISLKYCGDIRQETYKGKKYCFLIETPERQWHIQADNESEMTAWMTDLKQVRDFFKGVDNTKSSTPTPSLNLAAAQPNGSSGMNSARSTPPPTKPSTPSSAFNGNNSSSNSNGNSTSENGKAIKEDAFVKLKVIGRGSFGKVFKVQKKDTNEIFAMKVLDKAEVAQRNEIIHARSENSILRKLDCPFLVKMHYAFQDHSKLYFVMDYINGGELFFHLQKEGRFSEDRVKFYVAEIILGLEYLHSKRNIIYRDLKPENLLLSADGHIILTDFGISKENSTDEKTATFCGTPEYLAPEVLKQEKYTKAVDWWSLGTLMYEMLSGLPPFYSEEVQNMYYNIINTQLVMPKGVREETASLLRGFLEKDPERRLSDPEKIKGHVFFKGMDWDKLYRKEVKPPYVPPVKNIMDDSQISPEFTEDSIEEGAKAGNKGPNKPIHFEGFTFVGGK